MRNKLLIGGVVVAGFLAFGLFFANQTPSGATVGSGLNAAPDFTLQKLGGGTISLSEFIGKKPVVVDFWASWCPNCRRDMPKLNGFYEKYKDKVEVIGVNLQEKESVVKSFVGSYGIGFPIAFDPHGQAASAFEIQYTNTHFLIDINGKLVRTIPGDISETDIVSLIEQAAVANDQSYLPDEKPCAIASAENPQNGEQGGVCASENI